MVVIFDMMVTAWVVVMTKEFGNDDSGYQNRDEGLLEVVFREKMAITRSGNTGQGNSQIVTMTEMSLVGTDKLTTVSRRLS